MMITLTPEVETALTEQARQRGITPEQLAMDGLCYLFATPEPSEEEEAWYRAQAQLTLAQLDRLTEEMAQEDQEARRRESKRAERSAIAEDTRRMFDEISKIGWYRSNRSVRGDESAKDDEAREQELKVLRLEHQRLCAEAGREPGWLFGKIGTG